MFEKASRFKLRFDYRGVCTTEDLWDIPLMGLDGIFKELNAQLKAKKEESLLNLKTEADEILDLQVAIVRRVVEVRLAERTAAKNAKDKAERKQKLLSVIAEKQDAELLNMSVEDLNKLVEEL